MDKKKFQTENEAFSMKGVCTRATAKLKVTTDKSHKIIMLQLMFK